jgi:hypothetical protein
MNISFSLTEDQILDESKDVTRRDGWLKLKTGDILQGCRKCMGLKRGETIVHLKKIKVVEARRERLDRMISEPDYGREECRREGFHHLTPEQFVEMFCRSHKGCKPEKIITRIEFTYVN